MSQRIHTVFPSFVYQGSLPATRARSLNRELKKETEILAEMDSEGARWSARNYANGYSSYSSLTKLHRTSPHFADLANLLKPHVQKFIRQLRWNLMGRKVEMTTCWTNWMGYGSHHTLHIHPFSVISGVYYVSTPKGSSAIKLEDPRMDSFMAAPPRQTGAPQALQPYLSIDPKAGEFVLFESWMRHEVPPHLGEQPRISISFNYEWL